MMTNSFEKIYERYSPYRTYMDAIHNGKLVDWSRKNPWRAPGTAKVYSPCGVFGGNPQGCPKGSKIGMSQFLLVEAHVYEC
jgi:hypothetical protein